MSWFDPAYLLLLALPVFIVVLLRLREKLRKATTDLKSTRRQLEESQGLARIGSWELDLIRNQLSWSEEAFRIFEIDSNRFGASYEAFLNLIHPEDREAVNQAYMASIRERSPYEVIHRLTFPNGRIKTVRERGRTAYDGKTGKPIRSIGTVQDISQEVALSLQADRERAFAASLLDAAPIIILLLDIDGRIRHVNRFFESLSGYKLADVVGRDWFSTMLPEEGREQVLGLFERARSGAFINGNINPIVTRTGKRLEIEWYAQLLSEIQMASGGVLAVGLNVTYRHELEVIATETQERLRQVMDSLPACLVACSPEGRIIDANRSALDVMGVTLDEMRDVPLWESRWAASSDDTKRSVHEAVLAASRGITVCSEFNVWRAPDRFGVVDGTICPIFSASGQVQYIVAFGIDITQRKEAEATIISLHEALSQRVVELTESEQRFEGAFRGNPIPMVLSRLRDDLILDVNHSFEILIDRSQDQLIGWKLSELNVYVTPSIRPQVMETLGRVHPRKTEEIQLRTASGQTRTILMTAETMLVGGEPCDLRNL